MKLFSFHRPLLIALLLLLSTNTLAANHTMSLREIVQLTVTNHPLAHRADSVVRSRQQQLAAVQSGRAPELELSGDVSRDDALINEERTKLIGTEAGIEVRENVTNIIRSFSEIPELLSEVQASLYERRAQRETLIYQTIMAAVNVEMARKDVQIDRENLQRHLNSVKRAHALREHKQFDVDNFEPNRQRLALVKTQIASSERDLMLAKNRFTALTRLPAPAKIILPHIRRHVLPRKQDAFVHQVLMTTPELLAVSSTAKAKRYLANAVKTEMLPEIVIHGGYRKETRRNGIDTKDRHFVIGAELNWRLSLGGKQVHDIQAAKADALTALYQAQAVRLQVEQHAKDLFVEFTKSADIVKNGKHAADYQALVSEGYLKEFHGGHRAWLNVLDSQRDLSNNQHRLVRFQVERYAAYYRMQALLAQLEERYLRD